MISPEHLSNEEIERLAYASGDALLQEAVRRIETASEEDDRDEEIASLEKQLANAGIELEDAETDNAKLREILDDCYDALLNYPRKHKALLARIVAEK